MSRSHPARQALLLGQYEQALATIIEQAHKVADSWWMADLQHAVLTIKATAEAALQGKRVFRLGEPPAEQKPCKRSGETNGKSKR